VGAGTDPANPSQAEQGEKVDPKVVAALKALDDAGVRVYTQQQFNGHMGAARQTWQTDADKKAQDATADAQAKVLQEQGQFKPLYEQAQTAIQQHEATIKERDTVIASLGTHVNADIDALVKNLPPVLKELDPGADNLAARMDWIAKIRKHPEALNQGGAVAGQGGQPRSFGNGQNPRASGQTTPNDVRAPVSRRQF
jgi:hypothetical protein